MDEPKASPLISPERSGHEGKRFVFIDALRGVAALSVVNYHYATTEGFEEVYRNLIPAPLMSVLCFGQFGVYIFFVISGFVIAYSLRGAPITPSYFGRFVLRRSIRLDPLYWSVVAITLALNILTVRYISNVPGPDRSFPGLGVVLANLFYVQGILGVPWIVVVAWTLCLEVQFYLIYAAGIAVCQRIRKIWGFGFPSLLHALVFLPLFVISICSKLPEPGYVPTIFITLWHLFFLGVAVWWVLEKSMHPVWLWLAIIAELAVGVIYGIDVNLVGGAVAAIVYLVGVGGRLESWSGGEFFQFFGRISYSLYLAHGLFGQKLIKLGNRVTGSGTLSALFWLVVGYAVAIGSAYLMYRFIERPSVRLASRIKKDRRVPPLVTAAS